MPFVTQAKDLYRSDWFFKAKEYAQKFDSWHILSAKHGLLNPTDVVEPYEMTLNSMRSCERILWSENVAKKLIDRYGIAEATILGGEKYREYLIPILKEQNWIVNIPMQGLAIGKQLKWLKEKT
jgi:hypothetical protein